MRATTGTLVLFVIFTVIGVIILLNVLIAVISDSYEKATMSGSLLFGRARVFYVAQNEALEGILKPRPKKPISYSSNPQQQQRRCKPLRRFRCLMRWSVLCAILGTAIHSFLFLVLLIIALVKHSQWIYFGLGKYLLRLVTFVFCEN
jgi:hypothetical protein